MKKEKKKSIFKPTGGFPGGSDGKESVCYAEDPGLIPRMGRSPEERNSYPLHLPGEFHGQEPGGLESMESQRVGPN